MPSVGSCPQSTDPNIQLPIPGSLIPDATCPTSNSSSSPKTCLLYQLLQMVNRSSHFQVDGPASVSLCIPHPPPISLPTEPVKSPHHTQLSVCSLSALPSQRHLRPDDCKDCLPISSSLLPYTPHHDLYTRQPDPPKCFRSRDSRSFSPHAKKGPASYLGGLPKANLRGGLKFRLFGGLWSCEKRGRKQRDPAQGTEGFTEPLTVKGTGLTMPGARETMQATHRATPQGQGVWVGALQFSPITAEGGPAPAHCNSSWTPTAAGRGAPGASWTLSSRGVSSLGTRYKGSPTCIMWGEAPSSPRSLLPPPLYSLASSRPQAGQACPHQSHCLPTPLLGACPQKSQAPPWGPSDHTCPEASFPGDRPCRTLPSHMPPCLLRPPAPTQAVQGQDSHPRTRFAHSPRDMLARVEILAE